MLFRPYDRLETVSYAHRWAYGRNPAFYRGRGERVWGRLFLCYDRDIG